MSTEHLPIPKRTQLDRRTEAEARILESALELVAARGSAMMTLNEVGERAGYSRALPAHYFGNKDGLVGRLVAYMYGRFRRLYVRGPKARQGMPALVARVQAYVDGAVEDSLQFRALQILFAEATTEPTCTELRDSLVDVNRQALGYFEHQIQAAIAAGEVDPAVSPRGAAIVIAGAMRGALGQWFLDPQGCGPEVWRDELLTMITAALRPGRRGPDQG
jgi:AcrR family transcriptional regulator